MNERDFSAFRPIGPNYGTPYDRAQLLITAAKNLKRRFHFPADANGQSRWHNSCFLIPPAMTQASINDAVRECALECLGTHEPLAALMACRDRLQGEDWSYSELDVIQKTALRMLSVIYDADGNERESQSVSSTAPQSQDNIPPLGTLTFARGRISLNNGTIGWLPIMQRVGRVGNIIARRSPC